MDIKVINNIPSIKVTTNVLDNGAVSIFLTENKDCGKFRLGDLKPGTIIKIGDFKYVVLHHSKETMAIFSLTSVGFNKFGENADYKTSTVRSILLNKFQPSLEKAVGKKNLIPHTVSLVAENGTNKGKTISDKVSLITFEEFRRYQEFIPIIPHSYWTATMASEKYLFICFITPSKLIHKISCEYHGEIHAYCILRSNVLVEKGEIDENYRAY